MHALALSFGFGLITASVLAIAAVGVTLQFGVTNYINFAYGSYLSLGAYLAWVGNSVLGVNFWLAMIGSALLMGAFAVVTSRFLLQPFARRNQPRVYLLVVTLGLWLIISNMILVIWGPQARQFVVGPTVPINIGPLLLTPQQLLIIATAVILLGGVHLLLTRTKLGKAMRAMSDDPSLAQVSGIDADQIVTITWLLTGFLIGVAGCVLALNLSSIAPSFGDNFLFIIFAAVILGGIGQPYGTMLGALIIGLAIEMSAVVINPAYKDDLAFAVLILMVLIRPQGLIPARGRH